MRADDTSIPVWDAFIRIFHWALVLLFVLSYLTGESNREVHEWSGYGIAALLVARIAWGFMGRGHARFASFVRGPGRVTRYVRDMLGGARERFVGHNPLGGWGVLAMLAGLVAAVVTGMVMLAADYHEGPLAAFAASLPPEETAKWIHETAVNVMLVLIAVHLAGVAVHWLKFRENIVRSMFTGRKPVSPAAVDADASAARSGQDGSAE
ncbi:MAG: cytochrome B [Lysobacter sp.]|nr:MAG: cytochrome B [Lysobacter sp.]